MRVGQLDSQQNPHSDYEPPLRGRHRRKATAYKVFKAEVIKSCRLRVRRFELCPEVRAKSLKRGYKIHEVPIRYQARSAEEGEKVRRWDGLVALWTLVKYRLAE